MASLAKVFSYLSVHGLETPSPPASRFSSAFWLVKRSALTGHVSAAGRRLALWIRAKFLHRMSTSPIGSPIGSCTLKFKVEELCCSGISRCVRGPIYITYHGVIFRLFRIWLLDMKRSTWHQRFLILPAHMKLNPIATPHLLLCMLP